jgi:SARP family transcriptional regulator, regulator of embCAB operon
LAGCRTRIQLCGRFVVELEGRRIEDALSARQGRLLLGYLIANRGRFLRRESLAELLWPTDPPWQHNADLRPLISRLRRVLGEERLEGRAEVQLVLPPDAWVDVEKAAEAVHDAEAAIALGRWREAWLPARVAWSIGTRRFMAAFEADWIEERRRDLDALRIRALECIAEAGLAIGGAELPAAERAARSLVEQMPYHEAGYRLLMGVLEARSNMAEALQVYEDLRVRLRTELGVAPSSEAQALHARLIGRA